jgi:prepilin-type N-terminal cleavage/methylation domain-containing protein/prepilin-type processing-associated H-X9-DG protein
MTVRRPGFTIIEVAVATAIVSLMAAVLLPAVMQAREAARRNQCLDNLKQISLASANYADVFGRFVPAYTATFNQDCPQVCLCGQISTYNDFNLHTWGSLLLPYLDAGITYDRINSNAPLFSPIDMTAHSGRTYTALNSGCMATDPCAAQRPLAKIISTYVCPESPRTNNPFVEKTQCWNCFWSCFGFTRLSAASDYHAIGGFYHELLSFYTAMNGGKPPLDRRGILNDRDCGVPVANVIDGLSHTIFCAETGGLPDLWIRGRKQPLPSPVEGWVVSNPGGCWGCFRNAELWVTGSSFSGVAPGSVSATCVFNCTNETYLNFIYSFHPGAGNVAMCDGSARVLNQSISVIVLCNLVTYRGGEVVGSNF